MKKSILLISAVCLAACLMAFGIANWSYDSVTEIEHHNRKSAAATSCATQNNPSCKAEPHATCKSMDSLGETTTSANCAGPASVANKNVTAQCATESENTAAAIPSIGSELMNSLLFEEKETFSNFFYDMGPRFQPITRNQLQKSESLHDFLTAEEFDEILHIKSVRVTVIENERQTDKSVTDINALLTEKQLELLEDADYGFKFTVHTDFEKKGEVGCELVDSFFGPHFVVVPETQASYSLGKEHMINYLHRSNRAFTQTLNENNLFPAKLYFTVTTSGALENISSDRSCGNAELDQRMIDLLKNAAGTWEPARNENGIPVDQELTLSFGLNNGC